MVLRKVRGKGGCQLLTDSASFSFLKHPSGRREFMRLERSRNDPNPKSGGARMLIYNFKDKVHSQC